MDFLVFGAILVIVVIAILFLPKRKGKEDSKQVADKRPAGSREPRKPRSGNVKPKGGNTKSRRNAAKGGNGPIIATRNPSMRQQMQQQAAEPAIDDLDLLGGTNSASEAPAQSGSFNADYAEPVQSGSYPAQSGSFNAGYTEPTQSGSYSEQNGSFNAGYTEPTQSGQFNTGYAEPAQSGSFNTGYAEPVAMPAPEQPPQLNQNIPATEQRPEIKMDAEPINHSTRVRKRVHEETKQIKEEKSMDPISFSGQDLENFDTPSIDDIFADPEISSDAYKEQPFAEIEETPLESNGVKGVHIAHDEVPQVSADLEPVDEVIPAEEPADEVTPAEEPAAEQVQIDDPTPTPEGQEQVVEPVLADAEEPASAVIVPEDEPAPEDEYASAKDVPTEFVPGSVSFKNSGLKFPKRPHEKKVSELLPAELQFNYDGDDVALSIESPDVKAPVPKDGMIVLYNSHIYKNGAYVPWDVRFEAQLQEGEEAVVDTGVGIRVPHGFGIKIVPVDNIRTKFGLELVSGENVSQRDAAFSLKFTVRSVDVISYVSKNQPLIRIKIFRI